eukprot:scaffold29659_cov112-Isochrysis_galbana.AAC.6
MDLCSSPSGNLGVRVVGASPRCWRVGWAVATQPNPPSPPLPRRRALPAAHWNPLSLLPRRARGWLGTLGEHPRYRVPAGSAVASAGFRPARVRAADYAGAPPVARLGRRAGRAQLSGTAPGHGAARPEAGAVELAPPVGHACNAAREFSDAAAAARGCVRQDTARAGAVRHPSRDDQGHYAPAD